MKTIILKEEQRKELCDEIAKLVFELKKNKNVECIYFSAYDSIAGGNKLEITIVKNSTHNDMIDKKAIKSNELYKSDDKLEKYGLRISISVDPDVNCYTNLPMTRWEYRKYKDIYNSIILYDKTGEYARIKESAEKSENEAICYYTNYVEVVPPLTNEINKAMELLEIKKDTENVKKFTKTKTFQKIIDM